LVLKTLIVPGTANFGTSLYICEISVLMAASMKFIVWDVALCSHIQMD
jgi:hypothetical protein